MTPPSFVTTGGLAVLLSLLQAAMATDAATSERTAVLRIIFVIRILL